MLQLLFLVTPVFMIVMSKLRSGLLFGPLTFYAGFWCFWSLISLFDPYGTSAVSTSTYLIVWASIISFGISYLLILPKFKKVDTNNFIHLIDKIIKSKRMMLIQLFVSAVLIYYYLRYKAVMANLPFYESRRVFFELGFLFRSSVEYMFYNWMINTLVYVFLLLSISTFVIFNKRGIFVYISLLNGILFSMVGQGRLVYFYIIIFALCAFGIKKDLKIKHESNQRKKPSKLRRLTIYGLISITAIYGMNKLTTMRMGVSGSLIGTIQHSMKELVIYFTGPFRALDYFLTSGLYHQLGPTYGRSTLSGLEELFYTPFVPLGKTLTNTANGIMTTFTVPPIDIGGGVSINAFYTALMNFYLDGGLFAVIFMSAMCGVISATIYRKMITDFGVYTVCISIFWSYAMLATIMRWNFSQPFVWIVFILLLLGSKYKKKRNSLLNKETYLVHG